jgi:iron complex outermembrane recepter protein
VLPQRAEAEIKPAEPDQGNACAGRLFQFEVTSLQVPKKGFVQNRGHQTSHLPEHSLSFKLIRMKRTVFFICFASWLSASSQEKKDSADLPPVEVRAVTASATAPFAKTNLERKDIAKQNLGQDLPFLLNQTPSVVVNSDAGNGVGYTGIRIRGTDATRINVTLNGIPYNDAESQGTYFVDLPDFASSVNRIQVQRGVGTSTNGAGAFGATLNFSTNEVNRKAYADINNSYGSFNTWKNTIKAGTGLLGNHFTIDARASNVSSDGYIDRASTDLKSLYFSAAYLSEKNDLRLNVLSGKEKTYQAWYGVAESDLKTHRTINYAGTEKPGEPYENETDNYWQDHYQLFYTHRFNPNISFNVAGFLTNGKGYYEEYRAGQNYADYGVNYPVVAGDTLFETDLIRQLWLKNHFYGAIFSVQYQSSRSSLTFGGAVTKYDGNHFGEVTWSEHPWNGPKSWYDLDAFKRDLNIYGKWQYDISEVLQVFADMQYRGVMYDLLGFEHNPDLLIHKTYGFFNPKTGLSYHKNNWLAYGSYSIAHKEPNRDDFEAGKTQLPKPESLQDWEIGVERKTSRVFLSAGVYYMNYKDQLVLTGKINDVGSYTRTNIPKSYRAGIELQGSSTINKWLKAGANLTLSKNRIKGFTEYVDAYDTSYTWIGQKTNVYKESDISFSPNIIGAATITILPMKHLNIDLVSKYVSKQYLDNTSNEARKLNPYFTEDIRTVYSFTTKWLKNVDVILQVNNIFNKKYEPNGYTFSYYTGSDLTTENYYFPMAGTNFFAGINIRL